MIICTIFDNSGNFISRIGGANGLPTSIKRVPLAELPTNTPSPSFVMGVKSKSTGCETSSSSCSGGLTVNRNELIDHSSSARTIDAPLENDHVLDSYKTPMKQLEGFNLIDSVSVSGTLDDDFDESILEEIDALCEQNSAAKAEMQVSNGDIHTDNKMMFLNSFFGITHFIFTYYMIFLPWLELNLLLLMPDFYNGWSCVNAA
jgi:hypothetical protein